MKKSQLIKIIKEELEKILTEDPFGADTSFADLDAQLGDTPPLGTSGGFDKENPIQKKTHEEKQSTGIRNGSP